MTPNTAVGDVAFYGLSRDQAARYHSRLARMHSDRAVAKSAEAKRYARVSTRVTWVALAGILVYVVTSILLVTATVPCG